MISRTRRAPTRCNYCYEPAVVVSSWVDTYSSMGLRKGLTIYASACAEHEGCANRVSVLAMHPDAVTVRKAVTS